MRKKSLLLILIISCFFFIQPRFPDLVFAASNEKELFVVAQRAF